MIHTGAMLRVLSLSCKGKKPNHILICLEVLGERWSQPEAKKKKLYFILSQIQSQQISEVLKKSSARKIARKHSKDFGTTSAIKFNYALI